MMIDWDTPIVLHNRRAHVINLMKRLKLCIPILRARQPSPTKKSTPNTKRPPRPLPSLLSKVKNYSKLLQKRPPHSRDVETTQNLLQPVLVCTGPICCISGESNAGRVDGNDAFYH